MKIRQISAFILILCMLLSMCVFSTACAEEKTQITLMVDRDIQVDDIGGYLSEKYPDVDFDIVVGRTGVAYLLKAALNGSLPDVMISGNTWGRAGVDLYPYLYDLSATDIASEFYSVYLDNYTTPEGRVYWLPGAAGLEGILANKTLFEQNGIALPTDLASFVDACNRFTELGIRPYASDYKYNYTDSYLLQSWSIPLLQSSDGKNWRIDFEMGDTDILDEEIGLKMFENLKTIFGVTGVTHGDETRGYGMTFSEMIDGTTAMIRQSTNISDYTKSGLENWVLLPYFGETENDNWYFTAPAYGVAMNGAVKGTDKEDICLDIVRTLFTQECMNHFSGEYNCVTAYNKGITIELDEAFNNILPYIESNHLYSYLSNDNVQAASYAAVQKMIAEDASPADCLAVFNEKVVETAADQPVVANFDTAYSRKWTDHGSEAMSSIANTLAKIADCDILLTP